MAHSNTKSFSNMNAFIFLSLILVFCSAIALVLVKHYGRVEVMRAQELRYEHDALKTRWFTLQEKLNVLVTHARIQSVAEEQYNMHVPPRERTKMVVINENAQ